MTVYRYVMDREQEHFIVFTMKDGEMFTLYDSRKTLEDIPDYIAGCIVEKLYNVGGIVEVEV